MKFKAYAITNEIDLNKIASRCNIPKKYTWEEPLILQDEFLASILGHQAEQFQQIMIFAFGSIVFINIVPEDEPKMFNYLKSIKPDLDLKTAALYFDDYELREANSSGEASEELHFTDEYVVTPHFQPYHPELISVVIAKSVALERVEEQIGRILDRVETMIDRLEKANLRISDRELARTAAGIIRHEYNTINYLMILDKPDITWVNSDAGLFYEQMSDFFELNDRYEILKQKTDILNVIIGHFSSISHSIRGLFVEWLIVILILIEVVLMIADLLK